METLIRQAKLNPPDCQELLLRSSLVDRVLGNLGDKKLVVLCSAPGYGKKALMAQLLHHFPGLGVWYQFDDMDPDLGVLMEHIVMDIRRRYRDFGWLTLKELQGADNPEAWEPALVSFINELAQIEGRTAIFLKDFQLASGDAAFTQAIQFLFWNLPDNCTVFLSNWGKPELPLGRMRVLKRLHELGPEELQFEMDETAALFKGCCRRGLSDEEVAVWQRATEGWPAALAAARRELDAKRRTPEQIIPEMMKGSGAIYKFIDAEIWSRLEEEMQSFLLDIAFVPQVEVDICEHVYKKDGRSAFQMLSAAEERQLMISRQQGGLAFRLHPLFRDFLQEKNLALNSNQRSRVHYCFARAFEKQGRAEEAVNHYLKSGALKEASELLVASVDWSPAAEMPGWLKKWIDFFPREFRFSQPWLALLSARLCFHKGLFQEALTFAKAATDSFRKRSDAAGLYRTAILKNHIYTMLNKRPESLKAARKALQHAGNLEERIYALNCEATEYVFLGQPQKADSICRKAMSLGGNSTKAVHLLLELTRLHTKYLYGNYKDLLKETTKLLQRQDLMKIPAHYRFSLVFRRMTVLFQTGQYQEAYNLSCKADDYVQEEIYRPLLAGLRGQIELFAGRERSGCQRLETVYQQSSQRFLSIGCALNYVGSACRHRGSLDEALDFHVQDWYLGKQSGNRYAIATSLVNIGADKMHLGGMKGRCGEAELEVAHALAHRLGYGLVETQVHYFQALRAFENGRDEVALAQIRASLEGAAAHMHNHFILQEALADHRLLAFALEHDIEVDFLTAIFAMVGSKAANVLIPMLKAGSSDVRQNAVSALGKAAGAAAIPLIRQLLYDPDDKVRQAAEEALARIRSAITDPLVVLTLRETEMLPLIAQGLTNNEIAGLLHITEPTVKTHVSHIFRKLGLSNRSQAAAFYESA